MPRGTIGVRLLLALPMFAACAGDSEAARERHRLIVHAEDADPTSVRTAGMLDEYLERIVGGSDVVITDELDPDGLAELAREHHADLVVVLEGERDAARFDDARLAALGRWGFAIDHERTDDDAAALVWLAGNERLPRQYAAYELLRRLGTRFYHPEQEHVPSLTPEQLRTLVERPTLLQPGGADTVPDFAWRSWSFHSSHPLEHLEAFSDGDHSIDEAVHVNDWIVKNKGNRFRGAGRGIASEEARARRVAELEQLREQLGFPGGAGITLHNQQQGATAEIDPTLDTPVEQQIAELVARKLAEQPAAEWFGIQFGPTEFTTTPDLETVQWLQWAGAAARAIRPGLPIEINDHITGSQPSPNFDDLGCANGTNADGRIDYYDLAFHTDPSFGVQVHTVMFYPLEGAARVYAQRSFAHKLCLMQQASAQGRPLTYFPEGAWWLSFDNPVPVYLPLHIATRHRDIELLRPLLARNGGTVIGHRMFDSGHEWGYWQQDYAVGLLAWNAELGLDDVLGELLDPLCEPDQLGCPAQLEALGVMQELVAHQRDMFVDRSDAAGRVGGLYTYFAGEDDADEIAAASGLEFRPVRPSFADVMGYDADDRARFESVDLAALDEAATHYSDWEARLTALAGEVPAAADPWLAEIIDGVAIVGARARHTAALYRASMAYADATADGGAGADAAAPMLALADAALADAAQIIARREQAYRYPAAQTYGGGLTPETALANGTTYPYRVHTKTHLLTYWHNRHDEVAVILAGGVPQDPGRVSIRDAIAAVGEPLTIEWPRLEPLSGAVTIDGVGVLEPPATDFALDDVRGTFDVTGLLTAGDRDIAVSGTLARTDARATTARAGLTLIEPANPTAQGVLASVFPALEWGLVLEPDAEQGTLVLAHDLDEDAMVDHDAVTRTELVSNGDTFTSSAVTFDIPVALASGGAPVAVTLRDVVLSGAVVAGGFDTAVDASGAIELVDLVAALQVLAGFDEDGALAALAGLLEFDPDAPPDTVPFVASFATEAVGR